MDNILINDNLHKQSKTNYSKNNNNKNTTNKQKHSLNKTYKSEIKKASNNRKDKNQNKNKLNITNNNENKSEDESNDDNKNYISFNDFMKKKKNKISPKNESEAKITKNLNNSKNKNFQQKKDKNNGKKNSNIKEEKKKKKYSKERMEMNQKRLNNLYNDYKKILNKREDKKRRLNEDEIKDCSFSPKINKYSKLLVRNHSNYSKPIFLRNNDDKKKFNKKKYELNFTYIPKINKNSKYNLDAYNRLYNKKQTKNKNVQNINEFPFRPITNYNFEYQKCNIIPYENILKRQLLLEDYINSQKIDINYTPNTSYTSKSKSKYSSVKPEKQRIANALFCNNSGMISKMKQNKRNYSLNNINEHQKNNKMNIKNKKASKINTEIFDYINNSFLINNIYNNTNKSNVIKKRKGSFKNKKEYDDFRDINSNNRKENVVDNYLYKINMNNYNTSNKGICIDLKEKCKSLNNCLKKIIQFK